MNNDKFPATVIEVTGEYVLVRYDHPDFPDKWFHEDDLDPIEKEEDILKNELW